MLSVCSRYALGDNFRKTLENYGNMSSFLFGNMLRAWLVLDDCKYARSLLETPCVDKKWRYQWFATVALLKSVEYVLESVDTQAGARHKK